MTDINKPIKISIIIVNYRTYGSLFQCIESIFKNENGLDFEIIVIDNTPKKEQKSLKAIKKHLYRVKVIRNKNNVGFAKGINQGTKEASGKYLLFLNPDTSILNGCIKLLCEQLESNPKIGLIAPKLIALDGSMHLSCRTFPGPFILFYKRITFLRLISFIRRRIDRHMMSNYTHLTERKVDWVSGAFMLASKKSLQTVGFMDERFFLYMEDVDLCRRFWEKDLEVWYYPKAIAIHAAQHLSTQFGFLGLFRKISWIHLHSYLKYFLKYFLPKNTNN